MKKAEEIEANLVGEGGKSGVSSLTWKRDKEKKF